MLALFALLSVNQVWAQSTCGTATVLTIPFSSYTVSSYTASAYWFKVSLGIGRYQVMVTTTAGSSGKINKAEINTGTCAGLSLQKTDSLRDSDDSLFYITINSAASADYYIKLFNTGGTLTFKLQALAAIYIAGDIGYCAGSQIQLTAIPTNPQGSQSYSWTPSGSTGVSTTTLVTISATPTVSPATFTLSYTDNSGTYTTSVATFTLPASMCTACEMVQNGAFEATQDVTGNWSNLPCFCTGNSNGSDPKFWTAPQCGTSDYFSKIMITTPVGVPGNVFTTSTGTLNPNSGNAYAGFYNYVAPGTDTREYIQEPLKCGLTVGQRYNVSFYASKASKGYFATNNIGAHFSNGAINMNSWTNFTVTPQVNYMPVLNNPGSWQQITGTITGNGETYITVGNFYTDINTTTVTTSQPSTQNYAYYFVDDITVTPATPTITASNCISGSVTITAYGAPNSTITTWAGPSSYTATGSSITITSPTIAATYTCTVDLSTGCATCPDITQTITINPQTACSGTWSPSSYTVTSNTTYTDSPAYFANDLYVNSNTLTINSDEVRIASGKKIHVANGAKLIIDDAWLHACNQCSGTMWQGIYCEIGGKVVVMDGSIVEDATYAIKTQTSASTTPTPTVECQESVFNNNEYGIYIDDQSGANFGANISVLTSVFTCRNLGNHTASASNYNAIRTDILASTPLLVSSTNPIDVCNNGSRTKYGIYINHACTYSTSITVGGSGNSNVFDNQNYGIYSYRTSLKAINNRFVNLIGVDPLIGSPSGVGIYALNASGGDNVSLIVGNSNTTINNAEKNYFTNCLRGVWTKYHRNTKINNNEFDVETTGTDFRNAGSVAGEYAVINSIFATGASTVTPEAYEMANNYMANYQRALAHDFVKIYGGAASTSITTNTMTSTGSNYIYNGIYATQANNGANTGVPQDAVKITANTITTCTAQAINCSSINTSTATTGFVTITQNTELSIKYNPSATTSTYTPKQAAVYVNSCRGVKVADNTNIKCTNLSGYYPTSLVQYQSGVYINASQYSLVNCNTTSNIGEGFTWLGNGSNSSWKQNTMNYGRYGLVLRTNGSMGDQGNMSSPIYDVWQKSGTTGITSFQTLCDGTDPGTPPSSKLYTMAPNCTLTITYQPCTNTVTTGTVYTSGTTLLTATTSTSPSLCISDGGGGGGEGGEGGEREMAEVNSDSGSVSLDSIVFDNSVYPVFSDENRWELQYFVSSMDSAHSSISGCIGAKTCAIIDAAIASEDYARAWSLNNSLTPSNKLEQNWKLINAILINHYLSSTEIDSNDYASLLSVAEQCQFTGGNIVHKARALINRYFNGLIEYPDNCSELVGGESIKSTSTPKHFNSSSFNLFPNPNNGNMILDYQITKEAVLEITDICGILVGKYNLSFENKRIEIKNDKWVDGIYLYKIIGNNFILKSGKIVVIK